MNTLTIGQVAKNTGITVETVRFYEKQGLLITPSRSDSGYRQYTPDTLKRIRFIQRAKSVGFTLSEINELLTLRKDPKATCTDVKLRALEKIENIDRKLNDLKQIRESLSRLIMNCNSKGHLVECPILEHLDYEEGNEKDESRTDLRENLP